MSNVTSKFTVELKRRPCIAGGRPGYFHTWEHFSEVVPPSPLVGGHPGGVVGCVYGIVEMDNGTIKKIEPTKIKFTDVMEEKHND